jgi:hypothetical protein
VNGIAPCLNKRQSLNKNSKKEGVMKKLFYVIAVLLLIGSTEVFAQGTQPVQVSLINPVQIFREDTSIEGFRINFLYGLNANLKGFDLGLGNGIKRNAEGVQFGFVNYVEGNVLGCQLSAANFTRANFTGFQSGFYNYASKMKGFQLGLVNHTGSLEGLQIGLVNINESKNPFFILPIVNFSFR